VHLRLSPRARDLAELLIGYGLVLVVVWTSNPWQRILYWTAFAWIAVTAWLRRKQQDTHGLGFAGLVPSLWIVGAAAVIYAGWNYGMLEVFAVATIAAIAILILPSA